MTEEQYISELRLKIESYSPISDESWSLIRSIIVFKSLERGEILLRNGQVAKNVHFVCKGALRAYVTDYNGNMYTKNLFMENDFAGSTVSYLLAKPSQFALEALEDTLLISLNYKKYRQFVDNNIDLKDFYIAYLEKNWILDKEPREVSFVMEDATNRYIKLLEKYPNIDKRIQKLHIASHLGITPTQLSRIRKNIKEKD